MWGGGLFISKSSLPLGWRLGSNPKSGGGPIGLCSPPLSLLLLFFLFSSSIMFLSCLLLGISFYWSPFFSGLLFLWPPSPFLSSFLSSSKVLYCLAPLFLSLFFLSPLFFSLYSSVPGFFGSALQNWYPGSFSSRGSFERTVSIAATLLRDSIASIPSILLYSKDTISME